MKARLLREAVEENLATMNGSLPKPLRRSSRLIGRWGSTATVVLFLLVLIAALRLAPARGIASAPLSAVPHQAVAASQQTQADTQFSAPQRLSVSALALGVRRIVIDAGHGGKSLGTSAATGLHEKDVTLDIAERLSRRLSSQGVGVLMTRAGDDTLSLEDRSGIANNGRGDLFLSIHVNSLPPDNRGIETYFLGPSEASSADAVAASENSDSGYSMTDLRALIDMIYTDARKDESR
ncbi:MAG TPA: N-acetylmuramoyl-L-alanine amidase, partial [Vicinamibacterales bacterium]|nr:N-acetylmuramoyl-L-alanine amidase [Vicinamibacterales bacterium]